MYYILRYDAPVFCCFLLVKAQPSIPPPRPKPVPSRKLRNRAAHCYYGNSITRSQHKTQSRANQLANLSVRHKRKRSVDENTPPQQPKVARKKRKIIQPKQRQHSSFNADADTVYSPSTYERSRRRPSSAQTPATIPPPQLHASTAHSFSHADMLSFQQDADMSDRQMRKMAAFIRSNTSSSIIEPEFEAAMSARHSLFARFFETDSYEAPISERDSDVAVDSVPPTPAVVCTATKDFFLDLEQQHGRKIVCVHHGVDSGKGFLKFDLTLELSPHKSSHSSMFNQSDHGRRRVIVLAVLPKSPETIDVFRYVYDRIKLPTKDFKHSFHSDFKAIGIATGTYSFMFVCYLLLLLLVVEMRYRW